MFRIATTGLSPAFGNGAKVWGLGATELNTFRWAVMRLAPPAASASLSAKCLMGGDP